MITLIKSFSSSNEADIPHAQPNGTVANGVDTHYEVPKAVKASDREKQYDLQVLADTGASMMGPTPLTPWASLPPSTVVHVDTDRAIVSCFAALKELRPHLQQDMFIPTVRQQFNEGYTLVGIPLGSSPDFAAVMGYRIMHKLECNRFLYIDDLVTSSRAQNKGYAAALLDYAIAMAKALECSCIQLDSGEARHAAHRLYLNKGFRLEFHHFIHRLH